VVNITGVFSADFQLGGYLRHFEKIDLFAPSVSSATNEDFDLEKPLG